MKKEFAIIALAFAMLAVAGCESKQAKVKRLEAEYDKLNAQYRIDCLGMGGSNAQGVNDALLGTPSKSTSAPAMTPQQQAKCKAEKAEAGPARRPTAQSAAALKYVHQYHRPSTSIQEESDYENAFFCPSTLMLVASTGFAHAQFGSGIVFDPTQSAHAVQQIMQASQLYTTTIQTTQNVIAAYNLAQRMATAPQSLYSAYSNMGRQAWTSVTTPANTYGNTGMWTTAATSG